MEIKKLDFDFSVCKVEDYSKVNLNGKFCFIGKTDGENSLLCLTADVPANTVEREDNWKGFKVNGVLDFSLVGILSQISTVLSKSGIPLFAVSTYDTDYIFTKAENFQRALKALSRAGYDIM